MCLLPQILFEGDTSYKYIHKSFLIYKNFKFWNTAPDVLDSDYNKSVSSILN